MDIIFEDKNIVVINKLSGEASQSDKKGDLSIVDFLNTHMKANGEKNKTPYVVHRLDRPVGGLMVYAKTKEAASDLSRQVQSGKIRKKYLAIVEGTLPQEEGELRHFLVKDEASNTSKAVIEGTKNAKEAILRYRVKETLQSDSKTLNLVEILLITGRHHQIRVQFATIGCPIWGDTKYNPDYSSVDTWHHIALFSSFLSFYHPTQNKPLKYTLKPSVEMTPWKLFDLQNI